MAKDSPYVKDAANKRSTQALYGLVALLVVAGVIVYPNLETLWEKAVVLFVIPFLSILVGQLQMAESIRQRDLRARTK